MMKKNINSVSIASISSKVLLGSTVLIMLGCSTVRDVTDWVPGVDSNEEIQAAKEKQMQQARVKEREAYEDKIAFEPVMISNASEHDAAINVSISQQYAKEDMIKREDIGIEVNAGIVTLTGSVASDASAIKAISLAKSTKGVAKVISKLVVIKLRTETK